MLIIQNILVNIQLLLEHVSSVAIYIYSFDMRFNAKGVNSKNIYILDRHLLSFLYLFLRLSKAAIITRKIGG